jgi:hypothetical protein
MYEENLISFLSVYGEEGRDKGLIKDIFMLYHRLASQDSGCSAWLATVQKPLAEVISYMNSTIATSRKESLTRDFRHQIFHESFFPWPF